MRVLVTPTFARASKKLHQLHKQELDQAVRALMLDPMLGEAKVGDLLGVRVYKFRMGNQLCLIAYRLLLTRARQGMVIYVPEGDPRDQTRTPCVYDPTFEFLRDIGIPVLN